MPDPGDVFDFTGSEYLLSHGEDGYAIWARSNEMTPVERFPQGEDGWTLAWNRFSSLEPHAAVVPAAAPVVGSPAELTLPARFKKIRVAPAEGYGRFRGQGAISASTEGLRVRGRHVYPVWTKVLIIVVILLVSAVVFALTHFLLVPGLILLYVLVEYVFLRYSDVRIPWNQVASFVEDRKKLRLEFAVRDLPANLTPISVAGPGTDSLAQVMKTHIPAAERL